MKVGLIRGENGKVRGFNIKTKNRELNAELPKISFNKGEDGKFDNITIETKNYELKWGKPFFPILKNPKTIKIAKRVGVSTLALILGVSLSVGIVKCGNTTDPIDPDTTIVTSEPDEFTTEQPVEPIAPESYIDYNSLDFYSQHFEDEKYYLMLNQEDLRKLITIAVKEVQQEYIDCGAGPVFKVDDEVYSYINAQHIEALIENECSFRLAVVKNNNSSVYDISNLESFIHTTKDENGKIVEYHGIGMMNNETINYIVNQRNDTFKMENFGQISLGGEMTDMTWENLDIVSFVKNSNPQNEYEFKKALAKAIMFCVKTTVIYVEANIKNFARIGKHDDNAQIIIKAIREKYPDLKGRDCLIFWGTLAYNSGAGKILPAMKDGTLFDLNEKGEPLYNTKYPINILKFVGVINENGATTEITSQT